MRDRSSLPAECQEPTPTPYPPLGAGTPLPWPAVTIGPDGVRVTAPAGWGDRAALGALRPSLSRALSPPLPPAEHWPEHWREAFAERVAIAAEGGAADPEAVALADLRVMRWRELAADASRAAA